MNSTASRTNAFLLLGLIPILFLVGGCGKSSPKQTRKEVEIKLKKLMPAKFAGQVSGEGWHLPWYRRDPKNPNGRAVPMVILDAESGRLDNEGDVGKLDLTGVKTQIFEEGVHTSDLIADRVHANQKEKKIDATGNCSVVSESVAAKHTLTANRVIYDAGKHFLVATGKAHVVRKAKTRTNSKSIVGTDSADLTADKISWDMKHKLMIAEGNAVAIVRQTRDSAPANLQGNHIVYDLANNHFETY